MTRIYGLNRLVKKHRLDAKTEKQLRNLLSIPLDPKLVLWALDKVLDTQGVKSINKEFSTSSPQFRYCCTGDEFALTIDFDYYENKYIVTSYGNLVAKACI